MANPLRRVYPDAMMEHLGHAAAEAETEAEAEAFVGALVPLAAGLVKAAAPHVARATPQLVRGLSKVTHDAARQAGHPAARPDDADHRRAHHPQSGAAGRPRPSHHAPPGDPDPGRADRSRPARSPDAPPCRPSRPGTGPQLSPRRPHRRTWWRGAPTGSAAAVRALAPRMPATAFPRRPLTGRRSGRAAPAGYRTPVSYGTLARRVPGQAGSGRVTPPATSFPAGLPGQPSRGRGYPAPAAPSGGPFHRLGSDASLDGPPAADQAPTGTSGARSRWPRLPKQSPCPALDPGTARAQAPGPAQQRAEIRAPWIRSQGISVTRHAAALRPSGPGVRHGPGGAKRGAPASGQRAVRPATAGTPAVSEQVRGNAAKAVAQPSTARLQALVTTKERAHDWVRAIERIWDFYFELFGQRQSMFADWLLSCDRIALSCYQAAYLGVGEPKPLPAPPPFCYARTGFSPATFRRGHPAAAPGPPDQPLPAGPAALPPAGQPVDPRCGAARDQPQPAKRPWAEQGGTGRPGQAPARGGPAARGGADVGPLEPGDLRRPQRRAARRPRGRRLAARRGRPGPPDSCSPTTRAAPTPRPGSASTSRPSCCAGSGFAQEAERYQSLWSKIYPDPRAGTLPRALVDYFARAYPAVVDALCFREFAPLGKRSLANTIKFGAKEHQMTLEAAERLAAGTDPGIIPARFLIGSARFAARPQAGPPRRHHQELLHRTGKAMTVTVQSALSEVQASARRLARTRPGTGPDRRRRPAPQLPGAPGHGRTRRRAGRRRRGGAGRRGARPGERRHRPAARSPLCVAHCSAPRHACWARCWSASSPSTRVA